VEENLTPTPTPAEPANEIEPVEKIIAADLVKRGLLLAPVIVVVCALIDGRNGALSAAFALVVVLGNFFVSAAVLAWAAQTPTLLMAAALGSFLVRMVVLGVAVWAVHGASWVSLKLLAITILVTHLGLLAWETRYVSATLAYPALKPRRGDA
jgi:hypothetical protein